jgi:hypothetical protein
MSWRFRLWFHAYWERTRPFETVPKSFTKLIVASYIGHDSIVRRLLGGDQVDVNVKDQYVKRRLYGGTEKARGNC